VDGSGETAAFQGPNGVAIDSAGNVYVADSLNDTIRKITPAGVVTTLAGTAGVPGSADGQGPAARFRAIRAIAIDGADNLYAIDLLNGLRAITPGGDVTTVPMQPSPCCASWAGSLNGVGIAIDSSHNIYVADLELEAILKISPGGTVTTFAGGLEIAGDADGTGTAARFNYPSGLAFDIAGNLFVADWGNSAIRKITPAAVVTTIAAFPHPLGITVDSAGNLYVTGSYQGPPPPLNYTIGKITPAGAVTTLAGTVGIIGSEDGIGAAASFNQPSGIAIDGMGNLYVADEGNNEIRKITPAAVVSTFAGWTGAGGYADGTGAAAQFNSPQGLATGEAGQIYVMDTLNAAIRKVAPVGLVSTLSQIPPPTLASFSDFYGNGIAVDSAGALYYAETTFYLEENTQYYQSYTTTLRNSAGRSIPVYSCFYAYVLNCNSIFANIAIDPLGNVYVTGNQTIDKIDPSGNLTILAGANGVNGTADGSGASARFNAPWGIAIDGAGNLYVTDSGNNTIRKITPAGVVTTLAGTAGISGSTDGIGTTAEFSTPSGIAVDGAGNAYVADSFNNTIRKITPAGEVSTIAGQPGRIGFISGSLPGALSHPIGLALFGTTLYTTCNNSIVQVTNVP
jgi:sugar lactone lactonase YvrE